MQKFVLDICRLLAAVIGLLSINTQALEIGQGPYLGAMLHFTNTSQQLNLQQGFGPGFAAGYQFNSRWGAELAWHSYDANTTKNNSNGGFQKFNSQYTHADVYYYTDDQDNNLWAPYFVSGLGSTSVKYDQAGTQRRIEANIGIGLIDLIARDVEYLVEEVKT